MWEGKIFRMRVKTLYLCTEKKAKSGSEQNIIHHGNNALTLGQGVKACALRQDSLVLKAIHSTKKEALPRKSPAFRAT